MGASPLEPGMWVECVRAEWSSEGPYDCVGDGRGFLVVGKLYQIEDITPDETDDGVLLGVLFVTLTDPDTKWSSFRGREGGWAEDRFVPVYRRDETLTARLLSDVPADAPASPEEVVA